MNKKAFIKIKDSINYFVIIAVLIVTTVLEFVTGLSSSTVLILEKVSISIVLAVSLSLVVGFLGELSLGHAGFMCAGAYLGGKIACILEPTMGNSLGAMIIATLVGGAVAALLGVVIGLPALRLKGDYLAIVTLAFGQIVMTIFMNSTPESFGGALGLNTPRFDKDYLFIYALVIVLITLFVIQNLMRSKHGRAIISIRDNEIASRATGINVTKYKLLAFIVSAFFAGIAGVLFSYSNYTVQASKFGYNYSIEILVMVVLGGMGSINGSIIAAALITYLNTKLATVLTGDLAVLQNLVYSLVLILIVIYKNAPALKGFREKYSVSAIKNKMRIKKKDSSARMSDAGDWDNIPTKIKMDELLSVDVSNEQNGPDKANDKEGK